MKQYYHYVPSPLGNIRLTASGRGITSLYLPFQHSKVPLDKNAIEDQTPFYDAASQLDEYFLGTRTEFDLELAPAGTEFQQRVWEALAKIPFGTTASYGELALEIGKPSASRAVGAANGRNPIAIVVPCHRVIGKNGKLTGYAGGLPAKQYLLEHEGL